MRSSRNPHRRSAVVATSLAVLAGLAVAAQPSAAATARPQAAERGTFLVELDASPTTRVYRAARTAGAATARSAARAQRVRIAGAQRRVEAELPPRSPVLYRTHSVIAGVAVSTSTGNREELAGLPGVRAVYPIAPKTFSNSTAVPLQGAPQVWEGSGDLGQGMRIAIIDTGIDYTHANFGGPGTLSAYDTAHAAEASAPNPALFPSAKVAGGADLVGDAYDPDSDTASLHVPHPDPNPLDCNGHGSHVAGSAAGLGENANGTPYTGAYDASTTPFSTMRIGPGMAPAATLYAYKVFGCTGSTSVVTEAIDKASDPNGDGDPSDHVDVINMSLGSTFGSPLDGDSVASNAAVDLGITVVVAAGNDGDHTDIAGSPGTATKVITVANSQDATSRVDTLDVTIGTDPPASFAATRSILYDWSGPNLQGDVKRPPVGTSITGCAAYPAGTFAGKIAVVEWDDAAVNAGGQCGSIARSANLEAAGATGFVFANTTETFASGINGSADIPGVLLSKAGGDALKAAIAASTPVTIDGTTKNGVEQDVPGDTDTMAPSSSRGIHAAGNVKPDVTAVGTSVFSTASGTGDEGTSETGTSMAAPMVAGLAALVRSAHPGWTPNQVKAAIMNTAGQDLFVDGSGAPGSGTYAPVRAGAGRIQAQRALDTDVLAWNSDDPGTVSVSFGPVEVAGPTTLTEHLTVQNTGGSSATYTTGYDPITSVPGVTYTVSPASVPLAPGASATVTVTLSAPDPSALTKTVDPTLGRTALGTAYPRETLAEASGRVVLTPTSGPEPSLRVPVYAAPRPAAAMSQDPSLLIFGSGVQSAALELTGADLGAGGTNGTGDGDPGNDIISLVTGAELQATSGPAPPCSATVTTHCTDLPEDRAADLKYVGVTSDYPDHGSAAASRAYFAIATHGPSSIPADKATIQVDIDVDHDDKPDLYLYTTRLGSDDVFVSELVKPDGTVVGQERTNNRYGDVDTALYDSDVLLLPVSLAALAPYGITAANPTISYGVEGYSGYASGAIDQIGVDPATGRLLHPLTANLFRPGVWTTGAGAHPPLLTDRDGDHVTVHRTIASYRADHGQGLLLLHFHDEVGAKAQVVDLHAKAQAIAFPTIADPATVGGTHPLSATGGGSGQPVVFASSTPAVCTVTGAAVSYVAAGTCTIAADQGGDDDFEAAAQVRQSLAVTAAAEPLERAGTTTAVAFRPAALTAVVGSALPGPPTGTVVFSIDGTTVGSAPLAGGTATLAHVTSTGAPRHVTAAYSGDGLFLPSSGTATRTDPSITSRVSSAHRRSRAGWYRAPVTVAFSCTPHSAALTRACPARVTLSHEGASRSVVRTISATDGGAATATVRVKIDRTLPTVRLTGVRRGRTYRTLPRAHCVASDRLSKVATCTVKRHTRGRTVRYTAKAADRAGNVRTVTVSVRRAR